MEPEKQRGAIRRRRSRLSLLERIVAASALLLIGRLAVLQVAQGGDFSRSAARNRADVFATPAARGSILDARLRPLAYDVPSYSLGYIRNGQAMPSVPDVRLLARCLRVPGAALQRKFSAAAGSIQIVLASHVSPEAVSMVRERQEDLPGVEVIPDPLRVYPLGDVASHVIGYVNSIPVAQQGEYVRRLGFPPDAKIGWGGVERSYEAVLRGVPGRIAVQVDSAGMPVRQSADVIPPRRGDSLVLTLDAAYQRDVQRMLERQVRVLRQRGRKVAHAMAVALDPRTGAVLAMASFPSYRPEWFVKGLSYDVYHNQFAPAERNWVTQAPVAPGSAVKPLTALFALAQGAIRESTRADCRGGLKLPESGGTVIHCWARHDRVDVRSALAESCDVFFYKASMAYGHWPPRPGLSVSAWLMSDRRLALRSLEAMQRAFGLGVDSGIDLPDAEVGFVNDGSRLLTDLPYTAIGQNEVFTPLELAVYTAALANGGRLVRPHVVDRVVGAAKRGHAASLRSPTAPTAPTPAQLGVTARAMQIVREGMYLACNRPDGTAYRTFHSGAPIPYTVAGKTGTAETGVAGFDNSVFVGFAPYDRPRIAIAVVIPGGGHGAESTGPIARAMFDRFFAATKQENSRAAWNTQVGTNVADRGAAGGKRWVR